MGSNGTPDSIRDLSEALYGTNPLISKTNTLLTNSGFTNLSNLENLSFYELSYNWFVKRFYEFNTLNTNQVDVYPVLKLSNRVVNNVSSFEAATTKLNFDLGTSSFSTNTSLDFSVNPADRKSLVQPTMTGGDLYLNYYDKTFLTKNRLELIQNMVRSKSTTSVPFYKTSYSCASNYPKY